ncbi:DUF2197 domain-containing protein [Phosphitispora sp. TUW77]|uniref:DUF2197 domain-containing protein n=1 Tax=Phosphitispora sp. TUW77 TaxID=3152361 RepID=UPI003AB7C6D4
MQVRCMMCGKKEGITEEHVDYRKFQDNPKRVYICKMCMARTLNEAKDGQKAHKPM